MSADSRSLRTRLLAAVAVAGTSAVVLAGCSAGPIEDMTLSLGTLLPLTATEIDHEAEPGLEEEGTVTEPPLREVPGTGAAAEAAVALAVAEINAAGRHLSIDADYLDSGDAGNEQYAQHAAALAAADVVIGPAEFEVAEAVLPELAESKTLLISPLDRSTAQATGGAASRYWRTGPVWSLEGVVMSQMMFSRDVGSLVIVSATDTEHAAQATALKDGFERSSGPVVELIGMAEEGPYFNVADAALSWRTDAIAIIAAPEQTAELLQIMLAAGQSADRIYLGSEAVSAFASGTPSFSIAEVNGVLPVPGLGEEFIAGLQEQYALLHPEEAGADPEFTALGDYSGAAEAYDTVIATALAALAARSTDGDRIAGKLREVTGGVEVEDAIECFDYAGCVDLLEGGSDIRYTGLLGALGLGADRMPGGSILRAVHFDAKSQLVLPVDEAETGDEDEGGTEGS